MPDDNVEPQMSSETPPPRPPANTEPPVEAKHEVEAPMTIPPEPSVQPVLEAVAAPEVQSVVTKEVQSRPSAPAAAAAAATADATAPPDETVSKADTDVGDAVDAPIGPSSSLQNTAVKTEEPKPAAAESAVEKEDEKEEKPVELEEEEQVATAKPDPAAEAAAPLEPIKQVTDETAAKVAPAVCQPALSEAEATEAQTQCPAPLAESESQPEPTPAETAQRPLYNGLPQDTDEELTKGTTLSDTTPPRKPDAALSQEFTTVAKTAATAAQELQNEEKNQEESDGATPSTEVSTTMQGRPLFYPFEFQTSILSAIYSICVYFIIYFYSSTTPAVTSVPKNMNDKEQNKEATGDVQDAVTEVRFDSSCLCRASTSQAICAR